MPQTPARPRLETPPSRPAVLSRLHHEQGAQHHLARMFSYTCAMKATAGKGELPSLEHALQLSTDIVRYIAHLAALKEIEVAAAPVLRTAARTA